MGYDHGGYSGCQDIEQRIIQTQTITVTFVDFLRGQNKLTSNVSTLRSRSPKIRHRRGIYPFFHRSGGGCIDIGKYKKKTRSNEQATTAW
jgi:hypothetical protein